MNVDKNTAALEPAATPELTPLAALSSQFETFLAAREGREPAWLSALRLGAMRAFSNAGGFPTTRNEEYKYTYTSVRRALTHDYRLADLGQDTSARSVDPAGLGVPDLGGPRLVIVDGHLVERASHLADLPAGITIAGLAAQLATAPAALEPYLAAAPDAQLPFALLNAAFFADGAFVEVARNAHLDAPLQLIFVSSADAPRAHHPRVVIVAHEGAQLTVVEHHVALGDSGGAEVSYLSNVLTTLHVGQNANVRHARVVDEDAAASHFGRVEALLSRDSHVELHDLALGGRLVRNDASAVLDGIGGHVTMNGLYLTRDRQHVDNHTAIDHAAPHCTSSQLYKGILDGRSTAVFNGKVYVRPDAQKTNGEQSNRNLLLSREATVNTKPQLEIWADDVRCTHGATIGRLDEESLFYLESRGIPEREAQALLTFAFAAEVVDTVHCAPLRTWLESRLDRWMPDGDTLEALHAEAL